MKLSWSITMAIAVLGVAANLVSLANTWILHMIIE